jgi:F420-0:gamma-glutamyl ligase
VINIDENDIVVAAVKVVSESEGEEGETPAPEDEPVH